MNPTQFVCSLKAAAFDNVFNPYTDRCEVHDLDDAPDRRAKALLTMLKAAARTEVDSLWIGRDLGYRGGRRTGLALTDDVHLALHATRWNIKVDRATTGSLVGERTATVIWNMLASVPAPVFLAAPGTGKARNHGLRPWQLRGVPRPADRDAFVKRVGLAGLHGPRPGR